MRSSDDSRFDVLAAAVAYSGRGMAAVGSPIDASMSVLAAIDRPIISFAMGSPAIDAIPTREIADALETILASPAAAAALDYSPTEGNPALRRALLYRLGRQGRNVRPDCLLVTAGGMQGLDLIYRLFLDPGDLVIAESPSYANGTATARNHGADVRQVPLDREGISIDGIRSVVREAGRPPKLLYLIPTFQNPSGATYSKTRREEVLRLARELGSLIIEDDPYGELRYEGDPIPSLQEIDESGGRVIQVRTFSKVVAPGLRVGWVVAPSDVVARMVDVRQTMDTCANSLAQMVVARLIESGLLDSHIARLLEVYPRRRDLMDATLHEVLSGVEGVQWTKPAGGMFIWVDLPALVDGDRVLDLALENGVAVVPGSAFDPLRSRSAVRLCFTAVDESEIRSGLPRLGEVIRELHGGDGTGTQHVSPDSLAAAR